MTAGREGLNALPGCVIWWCIHGMDISTLYLFRRSSLLSSTCSAWCEGPWTFSVRWHTATILLVYFLALFMDAMRREEFRMSSRGLLLLNYIAWLWLCIGEPLLPQSIVEPTDRPTDRPGLALGSCG